MEKAIGKLIVYPLLGDISVGTVAYVDEFALQIYFDQLFLDKGSKYSTYARPEFGQTIRVERTSEDANGFTIDFSHYSNPLPIKTCEEYQIKGFLEDPEYIAFSIETEIYDADNFDQEYSRYTLDQLITQFIAVNPLLWNFPDDGEIKRELKSLRKHIKKYICEMKMSTLEEYRNKFMPTSEEEDAQGKYNPTGDKELYIFTSTLLEKLSFAHDLEHLDISVLEQRMKEFADNGEFEKCTPIKQAIERRKGQSN